MMTIKRSRQRFGLSKYQILLITFGKGLLIGYVLAFLVHRRIDSTQKLLEKLVERRMRVIGELQAVATANVMAAFDKLRKDNEWPEPLQALGSRSELDRAAPWQHKKAGCCLQSQPG